MLSWYRHCKRNFSASFVFFYLPLASSYPAFCGQAIVNNIAVYKEWNNFEISRIFTSPYLPSATTVRDGHFCISVLRIVKRFQQRETDASLAPNCELGRVFVCMKGTYHTRNTVGSELGSQDWHTKKSIRSCQYKITSWSQYLCGANRPFILGRMVRATPHYTKNIGAGPNVCPDIPDI